MNLTRIAWWGLAVLLLVANPARARTWSVSADGAGDAPTVQAAVDSAGAGDLVEVGPGFYPDTLNFRGKAITVRGAPSHQSVLDGMGRGSVVRFCTGEGRNSVLEGFTVTNGSGFAVQAPGSRLGGGIYMHNAEPTIRGNLIAANSAVTLLAEGPAGEGGGIYGEGDEGIWAPLIEENEIRANEAGGAGGGISLVGTMRAVIQDNVILDNRTTNGDGGGIRVLASVTGILIQGNRLEKNSAACRGGGIAVSPAEDLFTSLRIEISRNVIARNQAFAFRETEIPESGGGLWLFLTDASVLQNTIVANSGLGIDTTWGGGIVVSGAGSPVIERNIVAYSKDGGAVTCGAGSSPVLRDNLVWLNDGGDGAGCAPWVGRDGNVRADPLFCAAPSADYRLGQGSPALTHPAGVLGALDTPGCGGSPVRRASWGGLKIRYPSSGR